MPYTSQQLTQYYTSLTGVAPDAATGLAFQAYANQNAAGTQSDAQTLALVFNSVGVQNTFEVAESTYQFFTGATTSAAGLAYLEGTGTGTSANANGLTTAYYNGTNGSITAPNSTAGNGTIGFNTENRYYNFAFNLASSGAVNATTGQTFAQTYGGLTIAQTISSAYELIVGSSNVGTANANAAIADIQSRVNNGGFAGALQRIGGADAGGAAGQQIGLKAAIVGYILEEANKADVGTYAKAIDQFEASVAQGNAIYNTNLLQTYQTGGSGFNTGVGLGNNGTTTGATIALTAGTDTLNNSNATVAAGNVTFVAQAGNTGVASGTTATLGPSDTISAAGSNNTLLDTVVTNGANVEATGGALISGIQTINIRGVNGGGAPATVTLAQSAVPGSTTLNNYLSSGTGVQFTGVSGSTTVGVIGNGSVGNSNTSATFVSGTTANVALSGGLTINAGAENVTINGTAGTTAATTVNLTSSTNANRISTLTLGSATTTALNITANSAYRETTLTSGGLTNLNATGAASVNVGNATGVTTLTTVNAQNNTGGFTGSFTTAAGTAGTPFSVITGTGVDNVTIDAATANTRVNTSGGGDTITVTGAVTAGTSLNGGGGATLGVNAADFANISGGAFGSAATNAANTALITGFSTVGLNTALTAGTTYDINTIGAQNFRTIGVAGGGAAAVNIGSVAQVSTGPIVTFSDTTTSGATAASGGATSGNFGTLTVNEVNAATSTNDILNLRFQIGATAAGAAGAGAAANTSTGSVVAQGVETLNVAITQNALTGTGVAGTETLNVGLTDFVATNINFSGTENFNFTAANTFAQLRTITSTSTGNATIDASALNTQTAASPLSITTGVGNDVITVRDFTQVNTGGVTANAATGTAGFDTVNVATTTSGQTYSTVTNATAGLHIAFAGETSVNATKITLASTAVFQDYLDAAAAGAGGGRVSAFDFGGNTYLVEDNNAAATFQNNAGGAGDSVIQLVGIHTINATASTATTVILGS